MFKKYCSILLVTALSVGFVFADDSDDDRREKAEKAEKMREKHKDRHEAVGDDDREELEEKHSKEAKGKHKDKAKKPKDMHGRDWAAEKGKKHGWEEGKPAKKDRDRDDDNRDDERGHDHDHQSDQDDNSSVAEDPEHDVAEPQDPEQTLRDMAKDTAARKAGAEKGSASEALIHMGTDAILDRAKGDGGQSQ